MSVIGLKLRSWYQQSGCDELLPCVMFTVTNSCVYFSVMRHKGVTTTFWFVVMPLRLPHLVKLLKQETMGVVNIPFP